RLKEQVEVVDHKGEKALYDYVLMASHADETLEILRDASILEKNLLSKFPYHPNSGILHTDETVMPKLKSTWSSWNYRVEPDGKTSTIYWMNNLQGVSQKKNYFISINDPGLIDPKKILWQATYAHPSYDVASQKAQDELHQLNGASRVFFAGAYFRYGFHEDGLWSGLQAARALSGEMLWE
ncbi:MAG: NADP transhydrogenase subunit alpha, partial [Candidatus Omnitrophica bacterium]|nr:NADP transhydrogenase subunit alpha [Candidatus Omnitrophota bacterium]